MKWSSSSKNQNLPKLTQDEINNLNSLSTILSNRINTQKPFKTQISLAQSTKYLKKILISILHNLFQKIQEEFVCEG